MSVNGDGKMGPGAAPGAAGSRAIERHRGVAISRRGVFAGLAMAPLAVIAGLGLARPKEALAAASPRAAGHTLETWGSSSQNIRNCFLSVNSNGDNFKAIAHTGSNWQRWVNNPYTYRPEVGLAGTVLIWDGTPGGYVYGMSSRTDWIEAYWEHVGTYLGRSVDCKLVVAEPTIVDRHNDGPDWDNLYPGRGNYYFRNDLILYAKYIYNDRSLSEHLYNFPMHCFAINQRFLATHWMIGLSNVKLTYQFFYSGSNFTNPIIFGQDNDVAYYFCNSIQYDNGGHEWVSPADNWSGHSFVMNTDTTRCYWAGIDGWTVVTTDIDAIDDRTSVCFDYQGSSISFYRGDTGGTDGFTWAFKPITALVTPTLLAYSSAGSAHPEGGGNPPITDGLYEVVWHRVPTLALDTSMRGGAATGEVQVYTRNGTPAQLWSLKLAQAPDVYDVEPASAATTRLDLQNGDASNSPAAQLWMVNGAAAQRWRVREVAPGVFAFRSAADPRGILCVDGSSQSSGARVTVYNMGSASSPDPQPGTPGAENALWRLNLVRDADFDAAKVNRDMSVAEGGGATELGVYLDEACTKRVGGFRPNAAGWAAFEGAANAEGVFQDFLFQGTQYFMKSLAAPAGHRDTTEVFRFYPHANGEVIQFPYTPDGPVPVRFVLEASAAGTGRYKVVEPYPLLDRSVVRGSVLEGDDPMFAEAQSAAGSALKGADVPDLTGSWHVGDGAACDYRTPFKTDHVRSAL